MNEQTDAQLLQRYAESRSDPAFAELVRRHIDLVYSTALRIVGNPHQAQDVTQAVFVALAEQAGGLAARQVLSGWLYCTARNIAAQTVRADVRRRNREQEAAGMNELSASTTSFSALWSEIAPHLDLALRELSESDRNAILLRYFEKKSAAEMAQRLGITAEAAQKRVNRAVERLRKCFAERGVTVGAQGLVPLLVAHAVQPAPAGLAATVAGAISVTATTLPAVTTTVTKALTMTAMQKTLITVTIVVLAGTGLYEAGRAARAHAQLQALQQQLSVTTQEVARLTEQQREAARQVAYWREANQLPDTNTAELLKLRGELASLRRDSAELAQIKRQQAQTLREPPAGPWIARLNRVQQYLAQNPKASIPEIPFADMPAWLNSIQFDIQTEDDLRRAASLLRNQAQMKFCRYIGEAVHQYEQANSGQFPTDMSQLMQYCEPEVGSIMLELYQVAPTSTLQGQKPDVQGDWMITRKAPVNPGTRQQRVAVLSGGMRTWVDVPE